MNTALWVIVVIVILVAVLAFGLTFGKTWWRTRGGPGATGGYEEVDDDWGGDWKANGWEADDWEAGVFEADEYEGGARPFRLAVREPWFEQMTLGKKVVVGRLRRGAFGPDARKPLKAGDPVTVARSRPRDDTTEYPGARRYDTEVASVKEYPTFKKMLKAEGIDKVFPGVKTEAAALKEYAQFYSEADQEGATVVAIKVKPPKPSKA